MKPILILLLLSLPATLLANDIAYFEKTYGVKLKGIKPIEEYDDPDAYYTAIARQLGIPKLAFDAVSKEFGWKQEKTHVMQAIVRRGSDTDFWQVLIFRFPINPELERPDREGIEKMESIMVEIDDTKKVLSMAPLDETKERAAEKAEKERKADQAGDKHDHKASTEDAKSESP